MGNTHHLDHFVSRSRKQFLVVEKMCVCVSVCVFKSSIFSSSLNQETNKATRCWHLRQKLLIFQFLASESLALRVLIKLDLYEKYKRTTVVLPRYTGGGKEEQLFTNTNASTIIKTHTRTHLVKL